jgi:hypothetical protein
MYCSQYVTQAKASFDLIYEQIDRVRGMLLVLYMLRVSCNTSY